MASVKTTKPIPRSSAGKSDPVILITGASQGIGAAIARVFAKELRGRVRLALVARNARKLAAVARACGRHGARTAVFPCDLTRETAVTDLAASVRDELGGVDVLINNAGRFVPAGFLALSLADFDDMMAANLRSLFLVSKAFIPGMVERGRGDVFNMSSIAGLQAYPGGAGYCAAKFAVTGLSKAMRAELRGTGVRVCTVYPGATVSPSWEGSGVDESRMMPAEDVAQAFHAVYRLTRRTVVEEIVLRPQAGDV